jgi:glycosyltransferase involved in cell wall biosynthesis
MGNSKILRQLRQQLTAQQHRIDLLVADPTDFFGVLTAGIAERHDIPICLFQAGGDDGLWNAAWPKLNELDGILGPRTYWVLPRPQADQVCAAGASPWRVNSTAPLVERPAAHVPNRTEARAALSDNHPTLIVPGSGPLVVAVGEWDTARGLNDWIEAWRWVCRSYSNARLWVVGCGSEAPRIAERIRQRELTNEVLMLGAVDDWTDLMRAADLFIQTECSPTPAFPTLVAMSHGVPVLANAGEHSPPAWLREHECARTYSPGEPRLMSRRLVDALEQRQARETAIQRALEYVENSHSLEHALDRIEQWAQEFVAVRENVQS